jgi:hypothetical protein
MRRHHWWAIVAGGAVLTTIVAAILDLEPPTGLTRAVFWPVEFFLSALGPGPRFPSGGSEMTPVHVIAIWLGYGVSWAFWTVLMLFAWSRVDRRQLNTGAFGRRG